MRGFVRAAFQRYRSCLTLIALSCGVISGFGLGQEAREILSGLTVVAFGDQEVDILTGVTTLPDGGQVIDREHGITLSAEWLRYSEGEFVEAATVAVDGNFGKAYADRVEIDLAAATVHASGNVRLEHDGLSLAASALAFDSDDSIVRLSGPVTGEGVELEAAAMVLEAETGSILLVAPYRYQDELFELSSQREGALLSLTPAEDGSGGLDATSRVDPELLERLAPYLP